MTKELLIIVDIDGTIADLTKRLEAAGEEPKRGNRRQFQAWLDRLQNDESLAQDEPCRQLQQFLVASTADIIYLTGRSEQFRETTQNWLKKHHFPPSTLIMRDNHDWRKAHLYKQEKIIALQRAGYSAIVTIDDDGSGDCAEMYQRLGVIHLKKMNSWDTKESK